MFYIIIIIYMQESYYITMIDKLDINMNKINI